MTATQRSMNLNIVLLQQIAQSLVAVGNTLGLADQLKDLAKLLWSRIGDFNLMPDAPEKRVVHEVLRVKVGREDDQHIERYLQLLARLKGQVVDLALKGDDPAIQQILRAAALPAKVVDQKQTPVGFHLERRFIDFGDRIEDQLKLVEDQLTADHDNRSLTEQPAMIFAALYRLAMRPGGHQKILLGLQRD